VFFCSMELLAILDDNVVKANCVQFSNDFAILDVEDVILLHEQPSRNL